MHGFSRFTLMLGLLALALLLFWSRPVEERHSMLLAWVPGLAPDTFAHGPCRIPVHYALAGIDESFGFDELTVQAALVEAANLWQSESAAVLFIESDHPRAMQVSLHFDERQQAAITRGSLRGPLEREQQQLEDDEAWLMDWSQRIESARTGYAAQGELLAARARRQEAEIQAWNDTPAGRSEARRQVLEAESTALRLALAELEQASQALNADIEAYNRRAIELRKRTEEFRDRVARFNATAAAAPVESGRYSYDVAAGRRIEVFRAENYDDLVWVLAHELGHALGIGHVDDPASVMHATLHDDNGPRGKARLVVLGEGDRAALAQVCGANAPPP